MKFRHLAFLLLPIWLLDGCLNRDPNYYVAPAYDLCAPWPGAPLSLICRPKQAGRPGQGYQIHQITGFRLGPKVLTGQSEKGFFIIDRASDQITMYVTEADRDAALQRQFATSFAEVRELSWGWASARANFFFPYNWLYYGGLLAAFALSRFFRRKPVNMPSHAPQP